MAEILAVQGFPPSSWAQPPKGSFPLSLAGTGVLSPQPEPSVQAGERGSQRALLKSPLEPARELPRVISTDHSHWSPGTPEEVSGP